mmetsp:Transcript_6731/g.19620  ORF Transcript_6731/g.19620 Transcript_6731/m.19620 type:complete len:94 (+) Transcript_6731:1219-1500(+)
MCFVLLSRHNHFLPGFLRLCLSGARLKPGESDAEFLTHVLTILSVTNNDLRAGNYCTVPKQRRPGRQHGWLLLVLTSTIACLYPHFQSSGLVF